MKPAPKTGTRPAGAPQTAARPRADLTLTYPSKSHLLYSKSDSASRTGLRWFEISQTERGLIWLSPEPALNQA